MEDIMKTSVRLLIAMLLFATTASAQGPAEECAIMPEPLQVLQTRSDTAIKGKDIPPTDDFLQVDVEPTVVKKVEPAYPREAAKQGVEGKVWVKVLIDTAGRVRDVVLLKSDAEVFNAPAIAAARQFEFTPAHSKKAPVAVWVAVPFKFKLADKMESGTDDEKLSQKFLLIINDVIDQKDLAKAKTELGPEAYVIDGGRLGSAFEAVKVRGKGNLLTAERSRRKSFSKVKVFDDGRTAYMILRTESQKSTDPHFHTIIFSKNSSGDWRIEHWHVSK